MNIYGFIDGNFWLKKQDIYVEKNKDIHVETLLHALTQPLFWEVMKSDKWPVTAKVAEYQRFSGHSVTLKFLKIRVNKALAVKTPYFNIAKHGSESGFL